jgi:hypothetical protein
LISFKKKILITATAYPLPSRSYDELVCTAGVDENSNWYRIYPVPFKLITGLRDNNKIKSFKYTWIEIDLKKRKGDMRPESYSPVSYDFSKINILDRIDTKSNWFERKRFCLTDVYTNMKKLIIDSKAPKNKSLAVFKPVEFIDFAWEEDDREWKDEWKKIRKQGDLFEGKSPEIIIKKIPYKFYYKFKDDKGNISKMTIEDWELGALYWNCLKSTNYDEPETLKLVKAKFYDELALQTDLHLFLGTTLEWHYRRARNPFVIIGVFYPQEEEPNLFTH